MFNFKTLEKFMFDYNPALASCGRFNEANRIRYFKYVLFRRFCSVNISLSTALLGKRHTQVFQRKTNTNLGLSRL